MANRFSTSELLKCASRYPVVKGDHAGHPFHGNQWVEGDGGVLDQENVARFSASLNHFYTNGGTVTDASPGEIAQTKQEMKAFTAANPYHDGAGMMLEAVTSGGNHVYIAKDGEGKAVGALSATDGQNTSYFNYIGTTGETRGAAIALAHTAFQGAANKGNGVQLDATGEGADFWGALGAHVAEDGMTYSWNPDEVKNVANLLETVNAK
jgi:hypothetical protein